MTERPTVEVPSPSGGWGAPWPNVAEIEAVLAHEKWTLVGGLMAQLHAVHRGVDAIRPTNDVDIVLHVETTRGIATEAAHALESIGYVFAPSIDARSPIAHRFVRGTSRVDLVAGATDVLMADHAAPRVIQKLRGKDMMSIEGGTQALRRTINARLQITPERTTTISVPSAFGALILKAAAYQSDSRDKERHLQDAALLLSVIEDPYAERERFAGSDKARLAVLAGAMPDNARTWRALPAGRQAEGQADSQGEGVGVTVSHFTSSVTPPHVPRRWWLMEAADRYGASMVIALTTMRRNMVSAMTMTRSRTEGIRCDVRSQGRARNRSVGRSVRCGRLNGNSSPQTYGRMASMMRDQFSAPYPRERAQE